LAGLIANKLALEKHQKMISHYLYYYAKARTTADKRELGKLLKSHRLAAQSLESRIKSKGAV
jgi:hypothetical protein